VLVLGLGLASPCAAGDPAATCISAKLKAAGKSAQKLLTCHAKAVKKGEAVDPACLSKASDALAPSLAKAESKGGCVTVGDSARLSALVDAIVSRTNTELVPTLGASTCSSLKLKAAAKRAAAGLKAHAKAVKVASAAKLGATLTTAADKFSSLFAKGETKADCLTTGDDARAGDTVDATLDAVYGELRVVANETVSIPSGAEPAETPGSGGLDASGYPDIVTQFGTADVDLNNATYTRYYYQPDGMQPDAILILIPGFEGGAGSFKILAENLVSRAQENGSRIEVWAFDRRGHQLEDLAGQDIAEASLDPNLLLDWYYGSELGLPLSPELPGRRAIFHDAQAGTAFIANWTNLVFSRDIDAVVEAARSTAANQNVFLGGHSAGTGFTARYAATDFDLTGLGPADPGYAKLRGLVLLEGGGGSSSGTPPTSDQLALIEDRADGGLFYAVRDNAPRCADGTPCTVATEGTDCAAIGHGKCVEPVSAYAIVPGLLNPRVLAAGDVTALQAMTDPDTGEGLLTVDQGGVGNNAIAVVPELTNLAILGKGTAYAGLGGFLDDDGFVSALATFVRTSIGAPGPVVGPLKTWQDITEGPMPASVLTDNGPAPTALPAAVWGQEIEVTRLDRMITTFFEGGTNFTDWYYPSSGNGTTNGLPSLDSSALSVGRGRRDIENITQAANVDIPVICFGGSNGLTPTPSSYVAFGESLGTCTAPSCDGSTARVVDDSLPNPAFPTLGDVAGGFEVHITEGIAHVDITTAEDDADNDVVEPLLAFIERNVQ